MRQRRYILLTKYKIFHQGFHNLFFSNEILPSIETFAEPNKAISVNGSSIHLVAQAKNLESVVTPLPHAPSGPSTAPASAALQMYPESSHSSSLPAVTLATSPLFIPWVMTTTFLLLMLAVFCLPLHSEALPSALLRALGVLSVQIPSVESCALWLPLSSATVSPGRSLERSKVTSGWRWPTA